MSPHPPVPPRRAILLGEALIDRRVRETILGDLIESFQAERVPTLGLAGARRWLWYQIVFAVVRFPVRPHPPRWDALAMTGFLDDLAGAARTLRRAPLFTLLGAATLALGIGAATAIFSVADPVILRPLPFAAPDRLYAVWQTGHGGTRDNLGYLTFADLTAASTSFQSTAAVGGWGPVLVRDGRSEQLNGLRVSWKYFSTLGVRPVRGTDFTADDDTPAHRNVVILSHAFWKSRFGGDTSVVGSSLNMSGTPMRVAGVLPADYDDVLTPGTQIWRVLGYDATLPYACRSCQHLRMIARLKPGVTERGALAETEAISAQLVAAHPTEYASAGFQLFGLQAEASRAVGPALRMLLAGVALLLLLATVNVANLQFARTLQRDEEFAVRAALGAGGGRLLRQLVAEGLVLAGLAGVMGLAVASAGIQVLLARLPATIPRLAAVQLDGRAFGLAALVTIAAGIAVGLTPVWHAIRGNLAISLRGSARVGGSRQGLRRVLVASGIAVAVVLLTAAGLLTRSSLAVLAVNPGFVPDGLATVQVQVSGPQYADSLAVFAWQDRLVAAATAVPGVKSAALSSQLPLGGGRDTHGVQAFDKPLANPETAPFADRYTVSTGFLSTMGIPVIAGRDFVPGDNALTGAPVAIVSEALARKIWGTESAVGKRVHCGEPYQPWYTVVGVAGNVHRALDEDETLQLYVPTRRWFFTDQGVDLVVRTAGDPALALTALRRAALDADPQAVITRLASMSEVRAQSVAQRTLVLGLFVAFAGVALFLATAGLFAVLAGAVAARRREIGLRAALGATPWGIVELVLRQGLGLAGQGALVGLAGALVGAGALRSLLFGVGTRDVATMLAVAVVVAGAAIGASVVPAWRAVRIDPVRALRGD